MTLRAPASILLTFCLAAPAYSQPALKFEVATIKPSADGGFANSVVRDGPVRIQFRNMTLRDLIYWAYGNGLSTAMRVSGGPDWANRTRYEIQGQAPARATGPQFRAMLQALLEERFSLKSHVETQMIDVYALIPARSDGKLGPKVAEWDGVCAGRAPSEDDDPKTPRCPTGLRPPGMVLEGATMFSVAEMLSLPMPRAELGRIVEDRTRLTGRYRMELEFQFAQPGTQTGTQPGPSLITAVREQWGLKLEPVKGPLELRIVDSAALPTEN